MNSPLKYIDAVRGYAILGVIMIHSQGYVQSNNIYLSAFANKGKYGVQLFFIVSAFTLFLSQQRRGKIEKKNFFIRRFFRIAPMYYLGIIFYLFLFKDVSNVYNSNLKYCGEYIISEINILSNFIFLNSIAPHWCSTIVPGGATISVEMIFYLMVPFLFSKIKTLDSAVKFLLGSIFFNFILSITLNKILIIECNELKDLFIYRYFFNQLPVFTLGIIAYLIIVKQDFKLNNNTLLFLFVFVFVYFVWNMVITKFHLASFSAFLFLLVLSKTNSKLLVNDIIAFVGKISYSAYIVHFIVIYYLDMVLIRFNFSFSFIPFFITSLLLTIFIANIFRHLIETKFIKLGKKILKKNTL